MGDTLKHSLGTALRSHIAAQPVQAKTVADRKAELLAKLAQTKQELDSIDAEPPTVIERVWECVACSDPVATDKLFCSPCVDAMQAKSRIVLANG